MNFHTRTVCKCRGAGQVCSGRREKALKDLDSDEWYNLGLDLEEMDPIQAPDAYREAIRLDPFNADAHVNLGVSTS